MALHIHCVVRILLRFTTMQQHIKFCKFIAIENNIQSSSNGSALLYSFALCSTSLTSHVNFAFFQLCGNSAVLVFVFTEVTFLQSYKSHKR